MGQVDTTHSSNSTNAAVAGSRVQIQTARSGVRIKNQLCHSNSSRILREMARWRTQLWAVSGRDPLIRVWTSEG
ncbi:uncharacterized protein LOC143899403 isoform X2 [Temnothorax americanus]|uniref:uncharacterized protein LOC143899403 isoform X2 n=1 Tax=Temnothorax americanus TaxID=1964332 RepID=UPI004067AA7F